METAFTIFVARRLKKSDVYFLYILIQPIWECLVTNTFDLQESSRWLAAKNM